VSKVSDKTTGIIVAGGVAVAGMYIFKDEILSIFGGNEHDRNVTTLAKFLNEEPLSDEEEEITTELIHNELLKERNTGVITPEEYDKAIEYDSTHDISTVSISNLMAIDTKINRKINELYANDTFTQDDLDTLNLWYDTSHTIGIKLRAALSALREEDKQSYRSGLREALWSFANSYAGHVIIAFASSATLIAYLLKKRGGRGGGPINWLIRKIRELDSPDDPLNPKFLKFRPMATPAYTYSSPHTNLDYNPEPIHGPEIINKKINEKTYPSPTATVVPAPEDTPPLSTFQLTYLEAFTALWTKAIAVPPGYGEPGIISQEVYTHLEPYLPDRYQGLIPDPSNPPDVIEFIDNFIPVEIQSYPADEKTKWFINNGGWWVLDNFVCSAIAGVVALPFILPSVTPELSATLARITSSISPYVVGGL